MTIPVEKTKKKQKKTLGPGESEVWSGRGGWACPLTCKVFLFFFGFLEWNRHLLATTLGFFRLFQFSRSDVEVIWDVGWDGRLGKFQWFP